MLLDLILISAFSFVFMIGLFGYYQPKINNMEKVYNDLNSKIGDKLKNMTTNERKEFFTSLPNETRQFYNDIMDGNMTFSGLSQLNSIQEHIQNTYSMQDMNNMDNSQFHQFTEWAMNECIKAVTPFDHGGYVQGPGFNPSDTMHHQMNNDMNNFNNHMDHGMNDNTNNHFNGF